MRLIAEARVKATGREGSVLTHKETEVLGREFSSLPAWLQEASRPLSLRGGGDLNGQRVP